MTTCAEVVALAETMEVLLSVKEGRLSIVGTAEAVAAVKKIAVDVRDELIARLTAPMIELTHKTTRELIFHDPATGTTRVIPPGTPCRQFMSPSSFALAGIPSSYEQKWAATRNLQGGYSLVWLDGMVRGVSFSDVAPQDTPTHERT